MRDWVHRQHSLYWIRQRTGSQCNWSRLGVTCPATFWLKVQLDAKLPKSFFGGMLAVPCSANFLVLAYNLKQFCYKACWFPTTNQLAVLDGLEWCLATGTDQELDKSGWMMSNVKATKRHLPRANITDGQQRTAVTTRTSLLRVTAALQVTNLTKFPAL